MCVVLIAEMITLHVNLIIIFLFRRVEQKDTIVCAHFTENLEFDPFFLHGTIIADEK